MRKVNRQKLVDLIARLCIRANLTLPNHQLDLLESAMNRESSQLARELLEQILENASLAKKSYLPICQDCGMAVVYVTIGRECHFTFDLETAINEGVAKGYKEGYLRMSMLMSPIDRRNTENNTKAIVHTELADGDKVSVIVCPKGGGSENASRIAMLTPADGREGIIDFVVDAVKQKGASACPPLTLGLGMGGSMEKCAELAKLALLREKPSDAYADLEDEITKSCNELGIGVGGFGGDSTVLATHILSHSCHMATLPVAVNIQCHAARHAEGEL